MVPVDKAGNNIAIICKSYYISLLNNEILSSNFTEVDSNVEDILNRHKNVSSNKFIGTFKQKQ